MVPLSHFEPVWTSFLAFILVVGWAPGRLPAARYVLAPVPFRPSGHVLCGPAFDLLLLKQLFSASHGILLVLAYTNYMELSIDGELRRDHASLAGSIRGVEALGTLLCFLQYLLPKNNSRALSLAPQINSRFRS